MSSYDDWVTAALALFALLFLAAFLRERHRRIRAEARAATEASRHEQVYQTYLEVAEALRTIRSNRSEASKKAWATRKERKAAL